ncbi:WYL domain-containing protein [Haliangium sp.]|uniref:WYL domain-containing protein n=1 Tax=Haliangium sp. TaxID=2663208 RepID=UPI003D143AC7
MRDVGQRLRRLLYVVPYVAKHREGVAVDELASMLSISRDHMLKDLDLLSQVGPPDGDPGEYLLVSVEDGRVFVELPQRLTRPLRLTPAEGCSLLLGIRGLRESGVVPFDDAMASAERKLLKALGRDAEEAEKLAGGTVVAHHDRVRSQYLRLLVTAARQRTQVWIDYVAASRPKPERRLLDPYGLVHHAGAWYVVGHCHKRGDTRTFRIERIAALETTDDRFEIPDDFDLETYRREHLYVPSADAVAVQVHLDPVATARVGASWPVGEVNLHDDDSADIVIECEGFEWVTGWVLGFGQHAWIVQPVEARAAMRARLAQLAQLIPPGADTLCPEVAEVSMPDQPPASPERSSSPSAEVPTRAEILALVPTQHIRARRIAYNGDTVTVSVSALPDEHVALIRDIYELLGELEAMAEARRGQGPEALAEILAFVQERGFSSLVGRCAILRAAMTSDATVMMARKAYHDIRGGSFTALAGYLDLMLAGRTRSGGIERIFGLCRDHRKIIRNAVYDLDQAGYATDLREKRHSIGLLRDKWAAAAHDIGHAHAEVDIDCDFSGSVSDRCMEFAALDRVIYNLINNATEHTADGRVLMRVVPIDPDAAGTHLRFAVINRVTPAQRRILDQRLRADSGSLFEGGFTTGGHGLGLGICGDIVAGSYGLGSVAEAYARGYLGACLIRDYFAVWFHWPAQRTAG